MVAPVPSREEELYWLALKLIPGLGTRTSGKLLDRFRTPQAIFRASRTELEVAGASGHGGAIHRQRLYFRRRRRATARRWPKRGPSLITLGDPRYPQPLREIFDPPVLLFARGRLELLQSFMLGVVGTRRPTPYGVAVAERLSADLVARRSDHCQRHGARHRYGRAQRRLCAWAAIPSPCSAAASTSSIRRRTASWPARSQSRG